VDILEKDLDYIFDSLSIAEKNKFYNTTFLVTGCGGFLGFYLMKFLVNFKFKLKINRIIGVDINLRERPEWLIKMVNEKEIDFIEGTIESLDFNKMKKTFSSIDYVIHMASIASPVIYRRDPLKTIESNVWGLKNLLEYFKNDNLKGFLFFSSSEIYGNPPADFIPTAEDFKGLVSTQGPRACYDEAKRFGETLCYVYNKEYDIPITIVRPFNNYGPGMSINDGRVPADFAKAILTQQNLIIHSDGSPTRTFCYVSDAIVGYFKTLMHENFDTFNIGIETPEISIKELASIYVEIAKQIFGIDMKIQFEISQDLEYLVDNPNRRSPDISRAKLKLDYDPKIGIKEGVYRYMKFLQENPGEY